MMNMIACVDSNFAIGYKGSLLFNIPDDKKFFRETTLNGVVIMGRKTFESLPDRKPLSNRVNIVLSHTLDKIDGAIVVRSVDEALDKAKLYDESLALNNTYVIGGGEVYKTFLPYCDAIYLTEVNKRTWPVDAYFPDIHKMKEWKYMETLQGGRHFAVDYYINFYERVVFDFG